ncbi:MAG: DUF2141 domain-containing protein [Pseudomonadota bacterium]
MRTPSLTILASTLLAISTLYANAADLTVNIGNIHEADGQVMVGLYDTAEGFPNHIKQGQILAPSQRGADGNLQVVFRGLAEGTYAVSAIQDKNGDGKLSTNLLGVPKEPYGFSGAAAGGFGAPSFKDASVVLPADGLSIAFAVK